MENKVLIKADSCNITLDVLKKEISVRGSLGEVRKVFFGEDITLTENKILLGSKNSYKTFLAILKNMVNGVNKGFFVELSFVGLGYRFINLSNNILLKLGYSHYLSVKKPNNVLIFGYKNRLVIFGLDLEDVNRIGTSLRGLRKLDSYKGKGIRYLGEEIQLKVGKQR